jgi:hypothetical protein
MEDVEERKPGMISFSSSISHEMCHLDHNVHLANVDEFYNYMDEFLKSVALSEKG